MKASSWPHPPGTLVVVTRDDGTNYTSRTRSHAWDVADGIGVVLLEGRTGGYDLSRVKAVR